jgi:hypothetical protein
MPFITAAGLAPSKISAVSSDETGVARVQAAPVMQRMAMKHGQDCLLRRISGGICDSATRANRIELERMGRRAADACRFQEALTELKTRLAWKAASRTGSARGDHAGELACKAS